MKSLISSFFIWSYIYSNVRPTTAAVPTSKPTVYSASPSMNPTSASPTSRIPTHRPSSAVPTRIPSSASPTSAIPTKIPTTGSPTSRIPTKAPSTISPSSRIPSNAPSSRLPTVALKPTGLPSGQPTSGPTQPTGLPSSLPTSTDFAEVIDVGFLELTDDIRDTLLVHSTATLTITTSHSTYAETKNPIKITFFGELASSGPHSIGPFLNAGELVERVVVLARFIGTLKYAVLQNNENDGWLPSRVFCVLDGYQYNFIVPHAWVDTFNYDQYLSTGDGYEMGSQIVDDIPHFPVIKLEIRDSIKLNSITGVRPLTAVYFTEGLWK